MKLSNMIKSPSLKKLNNITESRFGFNVDYNALTLPQAVKMRNKIFETVNKIRHSSAIHTAEQNPKYLNMLIVYEGLSQFIDLKSKSKRLIEGELGQAQTMLAAKDMVDTIQDLIEKVGKMQNEQLPALIDSIRDQIGSAQADAFKGTVSSSLTLLTATLGQTREQLDNSARALTGENMDMGDAIAADQNVEQEDDSGDEQEASDDEGDGFSGTELSAGGESPAGRERR
jgi:hypothetical protein